MATYGEGDPTDNAQEFYEWLQNGDVDLSGIKFAVGLIALMYMYINMLFYHAYFLTGINLQIRMFSCLQILTV